MKFKLLFAILCLLGCEQRINPSSASTHDDSSSTAEQTYLIEVDTDTNGEFRATLPDKIEFNTLEDFKSYLPSLTDWASNNGYTIVYSFGPNISTELDNLFREETSTEPLSYTEVKSPLDVAVGQYRLTSSGGRHDFPVCTRTADYYAIRLNYGSNRAGNFRQVFDIHFMKYRQNGRLCFGVYESVIPFSLCMCEPPSVRWVRDNIYNIAVAVGVGAATAAVISEIAAPVVMVGLAI